MYNLYYVCRKAKLHKKVIIAMMLFFIVPLLFSCSTGQVTTRHKENIVWPNYPGSKPIIKFISAASTPNSLLDKKVGFLQKIWYFITGKSANKFIKPFAVFVRNGRLYLTDTGDMSVYIFDMTKKSYFVIRDFDGHRFVLPDSVTADKNGNIYVSDAIAKTIYKFNKKGKFIKKIGQNRLIRPTGIAIGSRNNFLYVVDTIAGKILVFNLNGKYIRSIGGIGSKKGLFNHPTFLTVNNGRIYIADSLNARVQIFDKNGKPIEKFGKRGDSAGDFANPRGVALDSDGNIYVTDTLFNTVQIFNQKGKILLTFGRAGIKDGEFMIPEGIAINNKDKIYVADSYNARVEIFRYLKKNVKETKDEN
ncbi:MAG: 6-bladed beta-propeller [Epsilonproteobacteria bacterium]|nr:6-bladed beta-propeller [Campylobacterota bacterium]